jgi:hypothetical protein
MSNVTTIDTNNFSAMSQAMGMGADLPKESSKASTLARLRIQHTPLMGQQEIAGKMKNVEVIAGGSYKLEIPDGPTYYAERVSVRPFLQRFMYKKFVKGNDSTPNRFIKTVMANDLNNRDAFKTMGDIFAKYNKMRRLPPQHYIELESKEVPLPNGSSFYVPLPSLNLNDTLDMDNDAQENFANFLAWIENYNSYILNAWDENMHKNEDLDSDGIEEFVDVDADAFA